MLPTRSVALQTLQNIAEEFVKQVILSQNKPEAFAKAAGAKVFTFGSFRLGVYGPGSDIDTLVVGPKDVSRDDFFKRFPDLLYKMAPPGAITDLTPVVDAFVPIIKFEWSGISIDLIFASLKQLSSIPPNLNLQDNQLLRGLEEADLRCVNGTRVTDAILELVPQKSIFRTALRGIKLWAQRRAIYANIMGFPGGVAWAMLVARVCQLYPKATSSVIILKFFRLMEKWNWPQPVLLRNIESGPLKVKVWNPRVSEPGIANSRSVNMGQIYKGDSFHLMPIITPAYPSMCATHNITRSTMEIINRELKRGGQITDRIMSEKAHWKDLFVKHTFFTEDYKYYLSIVSASTTLDAQHMWSGLVESKVRLLVGTLENHDSIALARPYNKGFERVHKCSNEEEIDAAKSGSLKYQIAEVPTETSDPAVNVKEDAPKVEGDLKSTIVYTTTHYIGLELYEGKMSFVQNKLCGCYKGSPFR